MTWTAEQLERWINRHAIDKNGDKIGTVTDIYIDDATGEPEWIAVTTGLFGTRISFVPLTGVVEHDVDIQVAYEKAQVKDSPNIDDDGELSEQDEELLYTHYGLAYRSNEVSESSISNGEAQSQLQGSGSVSSTDVPIDVARTRLRRRDAASIDAIGLSSDEGE